MARGHERDTDFARSDDPLMRFVATSPHIRVAVGTYLRIAPEWAIGRRRDRLPAHRRVSAFHYELPPDMPAGSVVVVNGRDAQVLWAEGARAVVEIDGRAWLMSHLTPVEATLHRDSYEPGSLVQEWVIRGPGGAVPCGDR